MLRRKSDESLGDKYLECLLKGNEVLLRPTEYLYSNTVLNKQRSELLFGTYEMLMKQQHEEDVDTSRRKTFSSDEYLKDYIHQKFGES